MNQPTLLKPTIDCKVEMSMTSIMGTVDYSIHTGSKLFKEIDHIVIETMAKITPENNHFYMDFISFENSFPKVECLFLN